MEKSLTTNSLRLYKGETVVRKKLFMEVTLGKYNDEILHDVVPMEATHGQKVTFKPLSPREVTKDQLKLNMKREKEQKEKREKERAETA
ncbi:hypothetical protein CR513_20634, partial [Mucuna pruriens]